MYYGTTEAVLTRGKSRGGNTQVHLAHKSIVFDELQPLDVLGRQIVFDRALDDHPLVGLGERISKQMRSCKPKLLSLLMYYGSSEAILTHGISRGGNAEVHLAHVAIVLDELQPLDVLCRQLVFDGTIDDHPLVGTAWQALLGEGPHPLLPPQVREHLDRRVGLDSRYLKVLHGWYLFGLNSVHVQDVPSAHGPGLGLLRFDCSTILPSRFCQIPISLSRIRLTSECSKSRDRPKPKF